MTTNASTVTATFRRAFTCNRIIKKRMNKLSHQKNFEIKCVAYEMRTMKNFPYKSSKLHDYTVLEVH